jgi:hypothetical protein
MKKIVTNLFYAVIVILSIIMAGATWQYYQVPNRTKLNFVHQQIIKSINKDWDNYVQSLPTEKQNIPEYDDLMNKLNPWQKRIAREILAIKPSELGFLGPYFGIEKPGELISIPNKKYSFREIEFESGINFVSPIIWNDFGKMNEAMKNEIGKTLDVENAYRTPGLSAKLFFYYLERENNWDLMENAKWIAMPGYSEHNSYTKTAVDVINQAGISGQDEKQKAEDFDSLPEFNWLSENASKYNFYLSYPKDNKYGVGYEPWHWHWESKR